jgi:cation-transporting P-type ATPase E
MTGVGVRPQAPVGLSEAEAARRLAESPPAAPGTSRSYLSIVRANVFTLFNAILTAFGVVTLVFGDARDALFLGIVVANSAIGITQEVRAKRAVDRLALLVAPHATVVRDGAPRDLPVAEVVVGDLVRFQAGDQIVADGDLVEEHDLLLDESILTGESEPARPALGDPLRSGAFAVEGAGAYAVTAVGPDSFAQRIVGEARSFRHPRSPLERAVNRLLLALVGLVVLLGGLLGFSLWHRHVGLHDAVATSSAGVVSMIPEGLMVLVSLTYAVAAARMARRNVLAQQLNAIESLASVDVLCVDKTGTLTEASLRVAELVPAAGVDEAAVGEALGRLAAAASSRNRTLEAVAAAYPAEPERPIDEVPFSSRRRWSAVRLADCGWALGAPERFALGALADAARERQREGRRVLALVRFDSQLDAEAPPHGAEPLGLVVLAERLRPHVRETIAFLLDEGVELKVLSGDAPETVAAIARDVGIPVRAAADGSAIPDAPERRREFALSQTVVGTISPDGKRAVVESLRDAGRYVAMLGDGVNDVPAMKASRLAIAQGTGAQMARSVADLVLVSGDFDVVPQLVAEGRRALRNLQRVAKLYVTKSAFAAFLILTIGTTSEAYPLLPRHLSIAAAIAIGIPTFFLALAPSTGAWRPSHFARDVARFAVPAGFIAGTGLTASYLFAIHDLDYSIVDSRTIATSVLIVVGLYLVLALEATGSRKRSTLVAAMCLALAGMYVATIVIPASRHFFELSAPDAGIALTAAGGSLLSIVALWLSGYWAVPQTPDSAGSQRIRA